jgi:hypothetical protein
VTVGPPLFRAANALEDALASAVAGGSLEACIALLADADVLVPAPAGAAPAGEEEVERHAAPGDELPLPRLELEGRTYVPVFTSPVQLLRFRPEGGPYLRLQGRAIGSLCPPDAAIAVNPGGELGCVIPAAAVPRLVAAAAEATPGPTVAEPAVESTELLEALRAAAVRLPAIEALHRAELGHGAAGTELVVGIALADDTDTAAAVEALAAAARAAGAERLALLPLPSPPTDDAVARFLAGTTPFYERVTAASRDDS